MSKRASQHKNRPSQSLEKGVVIRSTGARCNVRTEVGQIFECTVKGKYRIQGIKSTNPVAVGDKVQFYLPNQEGNLGLIKEILPRQKPHSSKSDSSFA